MDRRKALPEEYVLCIRDDDTEIVLSIKGLIGYGGSCLVYDGRQTLSTNKNRVEKSVIIKEFYPANADIERDSDYALQLPSSEVIKELRDHFIDGQKKHSEFYDEYKDQVLPRMFFWGQANNTVYVVSDPGKGEALSKVQCGSLELSQIASIMESICKAIRKIHIKKRVYLDCKPDNFFYYLNNDDLQAKVYLFDFDTVLSIDELRKGIYRFCSASFGWAPPEQELVFDADTGLKHYAKADSIGYHTDIYSIGAVFFWLLTGRKPEEEDVESIRKQAFDWKKESPCIKGAETEVIKIVQDILETSICANLETRSKLFRHYIAINAVRDQYKTLYGLTIGDNKHFEPIHQILSHMEENMSSEIEHIKSDVKQVRDDIDDAREAIENTIIRNSIKEQLIGTKKRILFTSVACILLIIILSVAVAVSNRVINDVSDKESTGIEYSIDEHVLLKLSNANHQYEVGLENWKRLDYIRAERDILSARDTISEETSQSEIEVAVINNSLGSLYIDMGRYQEAYDYLNNAYVTFRDALGDNSIECRATRLSIARYYFNIGKLDESLAETQYILDNSNEETDKAIIASTSHLRAMIFDAQGKYDEALTIFEGVLVMYDDVSKDGRLLEQLANYANDPGISKSEKEYLTNSIKWIVLTYCNIATVNIHKEDYNAAINSCDIGIELALSNIYIGKRNITTSKLYMNLAIAQGRIGNYKDALDNIDLSMRIQRNLFDFEDVFPGLVEVYGVYGDLLVEKGDIYDAWSYHEDAVELAVNSFGENHPDTAEALDRYGKYMLLMNDAETAVDSLRRALEIRKNILAENHPITARMYYDLAIALRAVGDEKKAIDCLILAKEICDEWMVEGTLRNSIDDALRN